MHLKHDQDAAPALARGSAIGRRDTATSTAGTLDASAAAQ